MPHYRILSPELSRLRAQGFQDGVGTMGGDFQERPGGAHRVSAALLPVTKGRGADADEVGKLRLGDMEPFTDRFHFDGVERDDAAGLSLASPDRSRLINAPEQLAEVLGFHSTPPLT